jgi:hypothetical protein
VYSTDWTTGSLPTGDTPTVAVYSAEAPNSSVIE